MDVVSIAFKRHDGQVVQLSVEVPVWSAPAARHLRKRLTTLETWLQDEAEPNEPVNWVVAVSYVDGHTEVHGPVCKLAADSWADDWFIQQPGVTGVAVTQLQDPMFV